MDSPAALSYMRLPACQLPGDNNHPDSFKACPVVADPARPRAEIRRI